MIEGCDSLGGMEREKAVYQSTLKKYKELTNPPTQPKGLKQEICPTNL